MAERTLVDRLGLAAQESTGLWILAGLRGETFLTYADVWERARRAAGALHAAGLGRGDRIGIVAPTSPEFLDALFGAMVLGAVPVPLYPPARLGRLDEYHRRTSAMAEAVRADVLVAPSALHGSLGPLVSGDRWRPRLGLMPAEALVGGSARAPVQVDADTLALIQYSSGTTVEPKPVGLTHRHIQANVDAFYQLLQPHLPRLPIGVSWLPLYHDLGLIGALMLAVCCAGTLVLLPPEQILARPRVWIQTISRFHAHLSAAPNFAYGYCLDRVTEADMEGCDLSSWRFAINGAEMVTPAVLRSFADKFAHWGLPTTAMTPVYGLAEATVGVTVSALGQPWRSRWLDRNALWQGRAEPGQDVELVSVGRPLPGVTVEIRGPHGPLPEQRVGHVWVKGPSLPAGYVDQPPTLLVDGWLDTGDLGFLWDGDLYISGRAKDVIILRGENHSPDEIERAVDGVPGIRSGCVAAVSLPADSGERLLVLAEMRHARPGLDDACRKAVLGAVGVAAEVRLLPPGSLPRTSSGKIRRREALLRFQNGHWPEA